MTTEATAKKQLTQNTKDLWSLLLVTVSVSVFALSFGYATTGNPLSVLTMPHNQSDAMSRIKAPASQPDWTHAGTKLETSDYGPGTTLVILNSWNTGSEEPTLDEIKRMLIDSGYEEPSCSASHCESAIQTTSGKINVTLGYHPVSSAPESPTYTLTAISRH